MDADRDECTYSLKPDRLMSGTLRLVQIASNGRERTWGWGLTPAQWREVLATLPAEVSATSSPTEAIAALTKERDELRRIAGAYEEARRRLVWRVRSAATTARKNFQEIHECADAAERRAAELDAAAKSAEALPVNPGSVGGAYRKAAAIAAKVRRGGVAAYTGWEWEEFDEEELAAVDALAKEGAP